jgi:hypothetical protein
MAFVRANPNQYLLVGRSGRLENRGSAVQVFLWPGAVYAVVPATKREAAFAFTQETTDGIPLRFKGIVIYRITDPLAAARQFDLGVPNGLGQIDALLADVCLGELRHAVSHMTMVECVEQRKTTLGDVIQKALQRTIHASSDDGGDWGITVEVAQVAQVFIVDPDLRQQLEAEIRNDIRLRSDLSEIRTREETRLTEMASQRRVDDQKLASEQERLRRQEILELADLARQERVRTETEAAQREALKLDAARFRAEMDLEEDRAGAEAPVRLLKIAKEREILAQELEMRTLQNRVKALEVEHGLLSARAAQDLRREILPLEQVPAIVESASKVLHGTNLAIYGEDGRVIGQVAPVLALLGRMLERAAETAVPTTARTE